MGAENEEVHRYRNKTGLERDKSSSSLARKGTQSGAGLKMLRHSCLSIHTSEDFNPTPYTLHPKKLKICLHSGLSIHTSEGRSKP